MTSTPSQPHSTKWPRLQAVDSTRQQLFGDLAHEIRTPVAVLEEAYIEALEDGVRSPMTPQTAAMLRDQTSAGAILR